MEASPGTLANKAGEPAISTDSGVPSEVEGADLREPLRIVRATAKLRLDTRFVYPVGREDDGDRAASWKQLARELYDAQRAVARGMNAVVRALWEAESQTLYDYIAQHDGEVPRKAKDWPEAKLNLYKILRTISPNIAGAMASAASRRAWQRWRQDRYEVLVRVSKRVPSFTDTQPIPLRAADVRVTKDRNDYMIEFALLGGRGKRWKVRIQPRDSYHREVLSRIASGEWKHGDILISRRKFKWFFSIAYKRLAPPPRLEGKTAAINRGIRVFLAAVIDDGDRWLYDGNDIVAYLKQMQKRRRQYQRDSKAAARSGRGRKRILRPIEHLSGKAQRWRQTKCQTIARRLVRWLDDRDVKTLLIEDFEGIRQSDLENEYINQLIQEWPFYQLEQRIRSCCEEHGIEVVKMPAHYISQQCPKCGHTSEANRDMRHWMLRCEKCGHRQHLDAAAATNLLGRERSDAGPKPPSKSRKKPGAKSKRKRTARKKVSKSTKSKTPKKRGGNGKKKR